MCEYYKPRTTSVVINEVDKSRNVTRSEVSRVDNIVKVVGCIWVKLEKHCGGTIYGKLHSWAVDDDGDDYEYNTIIFKNYLFHIIYVTIL